MAAEVDTSTLVLPNEDGQEGQWLVLDEKGNLQWTSSLNAKESTVDGKLKH